MANKTPTTTSTPDTSSIKLSRREIALRNLSKVNRLAQKENNKGGRKPLHRDAAKSMKIWAKMYLESCESVKDFEKWRKAKPHEALPWAYKAVYGDAGDNKTSAPAGQMHVLISILTGKSAPLQASVSSSVLTSEAVSLPTSSQIVDNVDDSRGNKT